MKKITQITKNDKNGEKFENLQNQEFKIVKNSVEMEKKSQNY